MVFRWLLVLAAALGFATGVAITAASAVPDELPGIALSSEALFHIERAGAVLLAVLAVAAVIRGAVLGQLEAEIGPQGPRLTLKAGRDVGGHERSFESLSRQINECENALETLQQRQVDPMERQLAVLTSRVAKLPKERDNA